MRKIISEETKDRIVELRKAGKGYKAIRRETGVDHYAARQICQQRGLGVELRTCEKCGAVIAVSSHCRNCRWEETLGPAVPKPCQPTTARPGTLEKIAVLAQRIANGESLFHDDDAFGYEGCMTAPCHSTQEGSRVAPIEERRICTTDAHIVRKDLGVC